MRLWMIGVVAGILPMGLLPQLPGKPGLIALLLLAVSLVFSKRRGVRLLAGVLAGCAVAVMHGHSVLASRVTESCSGQQLQVTGYVASLPRRGVLPRGASRQRFEFRVESSVPGRCGRPRKLLLSYYGDRTMEPGQRWRFEVRIKQPWGLANPGSFNMQSWFAQTRIDGVGSIAAQGQQLLGDKAGVVEQINRLRQRIALKIEGLDLHADARAVLQAVTVADQSGIDPTFWRLLQYLGINHLLVISGLHVGLVAGGGYFLGRLLARSTLMAGIYALWLPPVLALLVAGLYSAFAGFSVSTQRAVCMLTAFIVASLAGRRSGSFNNLWLAALAVLLLNPLAPLGSGFWLSFVAVAALLWMGQWQPRWSLPYRLMFTHLFMSLVMLPLGGWWFGGSSLVSAPVNLCLVPLIGLFVVPLSLTAALLSLLGLPGSAALWRLAATPMEPILAAARGLVAGGGESLYLHHMPGWPAMSLGLLAAALLVVPFNPRLKFASAVLWLPLLLPPERPLNLEKDVLEVVVLDVGQGTAIVIASGSRVLLYDTGGGDPLGANMARTVVLPYLRSRGVRQLDSFIVSHADRDHSAGAATVLASLEVGRVRYGGDQPWLDRGLPCRAGEAWRWPGGARFQILAPAQESDLGRNDSSCVLRVEFFGHVLLISGDIESRRERELVRYWGDHLQSEWLHVAHHGSRTSSSPVWLKHVDPGRAVISSGHANPFGHPHAEVVLRLESVGAEVEHTARSGALIFRLRPGETPLVDRFRSMKRRFWM